jgi:shikimate dehydrogenase
MEQAVYTFADLQKWEEKTAGITPPLRLSVFGDPVAHSASPQMQNAALERLGIESRYTRLHIKPDELERALRLLPEKRFIGTNVTIPHKASALQVMDELDEHARKIGRVNTVVVEGDTLIGFNTDGPGFIRAIRAEFSVDVRDLRVMILGAGGGAGRAIATQCAMEGCERLVLVNRTREKTDLLAKELRPFLSGSRLLGPVARLEAIPWNESALRHQLEHTDLVVNATSLGMKRSDPDLLTEAMLTPYLMIYDTVYSANRTKLLRAADAAGARGANGLSMLLYQGVLSFEIWFNRQPPIDVMRAALIEAVKNQRQAS